MYIVRINQLGYKEVAVHVNLVDTSRGFVTIDLKPDPGAAPPEEQAVSVAAVGSNLLDTFNGREGFLDCLSCGGAAGFLNFA
jgi:hypothetical protein